jgi:hypothetical protein
MTAECWPQWRTAKNAIQYKVPATDAVKKDAVSTLFAIVRVDKNTLYNTASLVWVGEYKYN